MTRLARAAGFTLIELMVALAIVAMTLTTVWATFRGTFKAKQQVESFSGRYRSVRLALSRLVRDLQMAYLSQNEDTSQPVRRTMFVGKARGTSDELTFSYFGHQRLYQDADEADTALVSYGVYTDRNDTRKSNLIRQESRRLQSARMDQMASEGDIACDDVVSFKLSYWDLREKKWREDWNTTAVDGQSDRLPLRVRITLSVRDERGTVIPFVTEARLQMQEPLQLQPVDAPTAAGPGSAPAPGGSKGGSGSSGQGGSGKSSSPTGGSTPSVNFRVGP